MLSFITVLSLFLFVLILPSSFWNLLQFIYVKVSGRAEENLNLERRKRLSVIVAIKGESPRMVKELLENMSKQTYKNFEVIIVSDDDERIFREVEKIAREFPFARLVKGKGKGLKAGALNLGSKLASGEFLVFLDVEARVEDDFLERASSLQGDAFAFRLKIRRNFSSALEDTYHAMTEFSMNALFRGRSSLGLPIFPNGSAFMIRKEVLSRVGGFKEGAYAEDLEIGIRLFIHGIKVNYNNDIPVYTISTPDERALRSQISRWAYGSAELLYESLSMIKKGLRGIEGFMYSQQWGLYFMPFIVLAIEIALIPLLGPLPFLSSLAVFIVMSIPLILVNKSAKTSYGTYFLIAIMDGYLRGLLRIRYEWRVTPKEVIDR
ncbi:Glycosyltransferase AglI [Sulfuracidifex tepidarius]|uniref:Glycosyltransferase AglI n=1 Tax=Sulfuracidifex tepidarius TaxID=1294262 RepID=A0A510DYD1_9CREN|nr:glycosyltransferase family 2 protein [Sulfuracidifex tepidarius]BBG25234.1 Glycosyltransferase AglI [Sulfuracidifex tepidarius]